HEVFEPVGIDVNLSDGKYCVISDGTMVTFPKPLKAAITKLEKLQYHNRNKQLGNRKQKRAPSNNARKYYKKLARLHKKVADARNDFLQKLTTSLARKYRHIKLETLNIKGMMANGKLARHLADASFYKFKTLLVNKVNTYGGFVESVGLWYPSSKLCSNCGNKKLDLKLSERVYKCGQCNLIIDRDLNSSINLKLAPEEHITSRAGSVRIYACEHHTANGDGKSGCDPARIQFELERAPSSSNARKQEVNTKVDNFG
nr:transposase [Prochloraceae cyanobacterium]